MPNVNDLNEYLSVSDVKTGDIVTFINAGEFKEKEFRGEKKTVFEVGLDLPNGSAKKATLNRTSRNALATAYTPNTESWIGKKAKVKVVTQDVWGTMKEVIYLYPTE